MRRALIAVAAVVLPALLATPAFAAPITGQVKDIRPGLNPSSPEETVTLGGNMYFAANDGTNGAELWKSDGTPAGTSLAANIRPGGSSSASNPAHLTVVGSEIYFSANDGTNGTELWKFDPGGGGAQLVKNIAATGSSTPQNLTAVGSTLYFSATDGTTGIEPWASDGTGPGTNLVEDIMPAGNSIVPNTAFFTAAGGKLFFRANNGNTANGIELWKSDSPGAGADLIDVRPGTAASAPDDLVAIGNTVFFAANDGTNGVELYKSDGTTTTIVKNIRTAAQSSNPAGMTAVGTTLFFSATDAAGNVELWKSAPPYDSVSTVLVKDINPAGSSSPQQLHAHGGTLFFIANDGATGLELWSSDGTNANTALVKDVEPGLTGSAISNLTSYSGKVFFTATTAANGNELWVSDGTTAGTTLVQDINSGVASSTPAWLTVANGKLLFAANDGTTGIELWGVIFDTTAPTLNLPADITEEATGPSGATATFTVTATDDYDPTPTINCSPASGSTFPLGTTPVNCTATDDSGNQSAGSFNVIVEDTTDPNINTPASPVTAEATSPAGATVTYTVTANDLVDPSPDLTCTPPSGSTFPIGTTQVDCEAEDDAGNIATESFNVVVSDTIPPDTDLDTDPGDVPDDPTSGTSAQFFFSGSDSGSGVDHFQCQINGGGWNTCASSDTFSGLGEGSTTFEVRAVDGSANVDPTPESFTWFIDSQAPDTNITGQPPNPSSSSNANFTFNASDGPQSSGIDHFECRLDAGAFAPCTSPKNYTGLADGTHTFRVFAVDNAGNVDLSPAVYTWTIDTAAPNTTITSQPSNPTGNASTTFTFTASDPGGVPPLTFQCRRDGGAWNPCSSPESYTAPEGQRSFAVRATDGAGNTDPTPATYNWVVDLTNPTVNITSPTNRQHILLHGGSPAYSCNDPLAGAPPAASGIDTCTDNGFNNEDLGPHMFTATAKDKVGHTHSESRVYVIDPPRYGDFVSDDDPVAYFRHNEPYPSSQTPQEIEMLDSSGNGHDGTYKNNVALGRQGAIACERRPHPPRACELANDPENKAAFFPERDGYGYVNGIPSNPTGYSMEAWIKPRTSGPMMVMSHGRAGQLFINSQQRLAFEQSQDTVTSPGPNIPVGSWTHVAATWDGSNTRLYVNGVQVAHSTTANKTPSGTSTFYVGYGEKAPWFHGEIDESAYYHHALSAHRIQDRVKIGNAFDHPSLPGQAGASQFNTGQPFTDPNMPKNTGLYAPGKVPVAEFNCTDPDDTAIFPNPGSDISSCTATVDGNPIASGQPLPDSLGQHTFIVTARDKGTPANEYVHTHTYHVRAFLDIYKAQDPVLFPDLKSPTAYYRLGEATGALEMFDSSPNHNDGEYKNDLQSSAFGISGDGNAARDFDGSDAYGYANGIQAPNYQTTLEAWVHPDNLNRDQSIAGHGDGGELFIEGGRYKFRHGSQNRVVTASPPYPGNLNSSFTQVVGTWDGVDLRIYVNGEERGSTESNRGPSSSSTFYVAYGELKPWFDGRLDEIAYYPIALSPNRVKQHFLADPAADAQSQGGGGSGGGSTGGGDQGGGDQGGGETGGADSGDASIGEESLPAGEDPGEPSGEDPETSAELQKCLKRAYKIGNKKKRRKAVKKCQATFGA